MRRWFGRLSIKTKLIAIVMLASSAALLLASTAFLLYEIGTYRDSATSDLNAIAQMIAGTSTAAVAFADDAGAAEVLNTLRGEQHVVDACIYRRDGTPLARYARNSDVSSVPRLALTDGPRFERGHLTLFRAVMLEGERVGTVYLRSDLEKMYARARQYTYICIAVLLASLGAAGLVSSKLQRVISRPILDLAETAERVSVAGNYAIRADKRAEDEIGVLVDRFNGMLEQVHSRDVELNAAKEQLEERVEERTAQLQSEIQERKLIERDLIAAKETAEASNKAKSAFLANMSHELRTPLNAIIGYSEMLEEESAECGFPRFIPDLRKIHSAGRHLLSLINDVLDLSKVEAGRMDVRLEQVEIGLLLNEAVSTAEPLARVNGNQLLVSCEDRRAVMVADTVKFRQSLLNLLSNACKFTDNGQVRLSVRRTSAGGRDWFDWEVADTGIGIPADQMHKLFRAFSQVDSSSTRRHGGTGLGLAISQRLCEIMGGRILVESEAGAGSKFTIRMPADPAQNVDAPAGKGSEARAVLAIDVGPGAGDWLERALPGFEVLRASSGAEGLRLAADCRPAAILLNLRQPDMDGWTLFRDLRADARHLHTPILVHGGAVKAGVSGSVPTRAGRAERVVVTVSRGGPTGAAAVATGEALQAALAEEGSAVLYPAVAFPAEASVREASEDALVFDLKTTAESMRQAFEMLADRPEWRRVSILRVGPAGGAALDRAVREKEG